MAETTTSELLAILSKVQPLLLPDLPSPPPSPVEKKSSGKRKLDEQQETDHVATDSKRLKNGHVPPSRPPIPPPPLPPPPAIDLKPPTPELGHSRLAPPPTGPPPSVAMKASPRVNSNASLAGTGAGEPEWRKDWPKDRLRKLGARCRDQGRRLKHSGDSLARRSNSPHTILLALAHQVDAILLYVFAFWCDDTASKTCLPANWSSVFGLIGFVKKTAEKENQTFLLGLCLRMEAIAIYTLSMHEQKALFYKATQLSLSSQHASTSSSSSSATKLSQPVPGNRPPPPPPPPPGPPTSTPANQDHTSPASSSTHSLTAQSPAGQSQPLPGLHTSPPQTVHILPQGPPAPPRLSSASMTAPNAASTNPNPKTPQEEFLKQFLRASPDLFRFQKVYDESCHHLTTTSPPLPKSGIIKFDPFSAAQSDRIVYTGELLLPNPTPISYDTSKLGREDEKGQVPGREEGEIALVEEQSRSSEDSEGSRAGGGGRGIMTLPIELARGGGGSGSTSSTMMVPSQVWFGRCLLKSWVEENELDFELVTIAEP